MPKIGQPPYIPPSNSKNEGKVRQILSDVGGGEKENEEEGNERKEKNVLLYEQEGEDELQNHRFTLRWDYEYHLSRKQKRNTLYERITETELKTLAFISQFFYLLSFHTF